MSKFDFKVGDKVYCPTLSNEILTVAVNNTFWFKSSIGDMMWTSFTDTGKLKPIYNNPSIFPATQEWYDKLVCIYPKLEAPPKRKEPREIIKAMLDSGWYRVPVIADGELHFVNSTINHISRNWNNFYPFDPETGKTIIDFIDGKVVLEN